MTATIVLRSWQIIWATTDINVAYTISLYRNSDFGGGVGGLLYAENADSSGLNYKHYNLRGTLRTCFAIDKCFGNCIVKQNILNGAHYLNCGMLK